MQELPAISSQIWDMKYRWKTPDGAAIDATVEDSWARVARAAAAAERPALRAHWSEQFNHALQDFKFMPAGRILAGAGTRRHVTLFNCFVMGAIPDDMRGIFEGLRDSALTMQAGGGIGCDFSTIRPSGALVQGSGAHASGPISFMDVWDSMCRTIMSAGARRGAMMACLSCSHPDIEAFIDAKRDPQRLRNFNLSILVTDAFMQAVKTDSSWDLIFGDKIYRTISARGLWDRIMAATYAYAEPGVIFIDRVNERNPLNYCETIAATNPCGEQPLPPYGACLLGSINLARLVRDSFQKHAAIDGGELDDLTRVAVRFLDNIIDISPYPLAEQEREAKAKRRIGLGVTGLADAMIFCGVRYGSPESIAAIREWMRTIRRSAILASAELAQEKGVFPNFQRDRFLATPAAKTLEPELREAIAEKGLRNGLVTSIAPTGTISLMAHNVSSGIEPVFAFEHERTVLMPDGKRRAERVQNFAYSTFRQLEGNDARLPATFVTINDLTPADHIGVQAAVQEFVDSSISKTVNVPRDIAFQDFADVYRAAYEAGCKGCTTYRPNEITGSVLSVIEERAPPAEAPRDAEHERVRGAAISTKPALVRELAGAREGAVLAVKPKHSDRPQPMESAGVVYMTKPLDRPEALPGTTYKVRWPDSDHAMYITLNDVIEQGRRRPFEIFINSKNMEHYAWTVALTRMISAVFRRGGDVSFVVEELKAVFDPRGGHWIDRQYVPSLLAAIGRVIEEHLIAIGFMVKPHNDDEDLDAIQPHPGAAAGDFTRALAAAEPSGNLRSCPKCSSPGLVRMEGCDNCLACGYSRCS
jgi:ribonucleoside-diphosphate reductase alpha chain